MTQKDTQDGNDPFDARKPAAAGKSAVASTVRRKAVSHFWLKAADSTLPRKTSKENVREPYSKPTQVDEDEYPKALERTLVQELGKLTP